MKVLYYLVLSLACLNVSYADVILASNFDGHGSDDAAAEFTGIVWEANGITPPSDTIVLSEGATVQTSGAVQNFDRLAVARNIDTVGPWSFDLTFSAISSGTVVEDLTFDYQFISNGGVNQGFAHPGSGIVTVSILAGDGVEVLSSITLPALGTDLVASNIGIGIIADFDDVTLVGGNDYILRFFVASNVALGNNFALDNLVLNGSTEVTELRIVGIEVLLDGSAEITWKGVPREYAVDYSFDLAEGSWLELVDDAAILPGSTTGSLIDQTIATDPMNPRVFYRVRVPE